MSKAGVAVLPGSFPCSYPVPGLATSQSTSLPSPGETWLHEAQWKVRHFAEVSWGLVSALSPQPSAEPGTQQELSKDVQTSELLDEQEISEALIAHLCSPSRASPQLQWPQLAPHPSPSQIQASLSCFQNLPLLPTIQRILSQASCRLCPTLLSPHPPPYSAKGPL